MEKLNCCPQHTSFFWCESAVLRVWCRQLLAYRGVRKAAKNSLLISAAAGISFLVWTHTNTRRTPQAHPSFLSPAAAADALLGCRDYAEETHTPQTNATLAVKTNDFFHSEKGNLLASKWIKCGCRPNFFGHQNRAISFR